MNDIYSELCSCMQGTNSVFSFLSAENLKEISDLFIYKSVSAGEILWKEGDTCDYIACIVSGQVEVKKNTEFEGKSVVIGIYHTGAIVGELCILDSSPRAVTAVALDDVSLALITKENFDQLISVNPELGANLMKGILLSVSSRLKKSFERLATFF